jgi:hypothetical protein
MYNSKVNLGNIVNPVTIRRMHVYFNNRSFKIELPFIYFNMSSLTWKDKNFFADFHMNFHMENNI